MHQPGKSARVFFDQVVRQGCRSADNLLTGTQVLAEAQPSAKLEVEANLTVQGNVRMSQQHITKRVVAKYLLLQLPALLFLILILLLLRHWEVIPRWVFWAVVAAWVAKDALLFPFVWQAYDPDTPAAGHSLIGARGMARERLDPAGYIRVGGELWRAELLKGEPPVEAGEIVVVRELSGLTLRVGREEDEEAGKPG